MRSIHLLATADYMSKDAVTCRRGGAGEGESQPPAPMAWVEFSHGMCETLNTSPCMIYVGPADQSASITALIDTASTAAEVQATYGAKPGSIPPAAMPRATFTTPENIVSVQKCTAIYGRVPFIAVIDMTEDDAEHSFVLDIKAALDTGSRRISLDTILQFLVRVGNGTEQAALQGAAPPLADIGPPTHGTILCEGRTGTTSSVDRLLHQGKSHPSGGAVGVFWSDRCPCCPGVLMMIEAVVRLIRLMAMSHLEHGDAMADGLSFPFFAINIDENELPSNIWPMAKGEEVVPAVVAFSAGSLAPVLFTGERSLPRLVAFICQHCFPESHPCIAHIRADATRAVAHFMPEELMSTIDEGDAGYTAAVAAYRRFEKDEIATEELLSIYSHTRRTTLPFSIEERVREVQATGGAAATRSSSYSPFPTSEGEEAFGVMKADDLLPQRGSQSDSTPKGDSSASFSGEANQTKTKASAEWNTGTAAINSTGLRRLPSKRQRDTT